MGVLILPSVFVMLFLFLIKNRTARTTQTLMETSILASCLLFLITEILSQAGVLDARHILVSWVFVFLSLSILVWKDRIRAIRAIRGLAERSRYYFRTSSWMERGILGLTSMILLLVFGQCLLYPPTNLDSFSYHLPRIVNWIINKSVDFFPTNNYFQLTQSPFAEYAMMHTIALSSGDYFASTIQYAYWIFGIVSLLGICRQIGLDRRYKLLCVVLAVTMPSLILNASNTKNDIVMPFFALASTFYAIEILRRRSLESFVFFGLSCGMAALSKGSAYIFMLPNALLVLYVVAREFLERRYRALSYAMIAMAILLALNVKHHARSYDYDGTLFGSKNSEARSIMNEGMSPGLLLSVALKNVGRQIGPYPLNKYYYSAMKWLDGNIGIYLNDPRVNFRGGEYSTAPTYPNNEMSAPNPFHFYLSALSIAFLTLLYLRGVGGRSRLPFFLVASVVVQFLLYSFVFKSMPLTNRLQIAMMLASMPVVCYAFQRAGPSVTWVLTTQFLVFGYAFFLVFFHSSRPYISGWRTSQVRISDERDSKYFSNCSPLDYVEYSDVISKLRTRKPAVLGLNSVVIGFREYLLTKEYFTLGIHPVNIMVEDASRKYATEVPSVDCIVTDRNLGPSITYGGRSYHNSTSGNRRIWYYEPSN